MFTFTIWARKFEIWIRKPWQFTLYKVSLQFKNQTILKLLDFDKKQKTLKVPKLRSAISLSHWTLSGWYFKACVNSWNKNSLIILILYEFELKIKPNRIKQWTFNLINLIKSDEMKKIFNTLRYSQRPKTELLHVQFLVRFVPQNIMKTSKQGYGCCECRRFS